MPQVQKANPCLKKLFYVLNSLLLIAGCLLLLLALWVNKDNKFGGIWIYVITVGLIIVSILGIFGARRENAVALVIFTVVMMVEAIFLFKTGIQFPQSLSQKRQEIELQYQDDPHKDLLMKVIDHVFRVWSRAVLGITFGYSAAAILGVILSMCLLRQIGPCRKPAAIPYTLWSDRVTVPNNAVPTTHDPMINDVPMLSA